MSDPTIEVVPFWGSNPNIIFTQFEFFPVSSMTYEQKLNAITRGILVLGLATFAFTTSLRILAITFVTILAIFGIHHYEKREGMIDLTGKDEVFSENNPIKSQFLDMPGQVDPATIQYKKPDATNPPQKLRSYQNPADLVLNDKNISTSGVFGEPSASNPFGNFLVSDYVNNPNKKPAQPAFNNNGILSEAKKLVAELNPGQPDISDKLFKDLGEQYVFEQSLRQFTSNPSTTLVNDQTGFADFCYGSMTSCKEGNLFACARNLPRHVS